MMSIKLNNLQIKTSRPELPSSLPVYSLTAPTIDDRRAAIARLGERMNLGLLRSVDLEHGIVMASERGDITCFHASGAVWARDATVGRGGLNEMRKWDGQISTTDDGQRVALNAEMSKKLLMQARELLQPLGLLGRELGGESVQLDQVAQLDAKGKEIAHGAGQAVVKFQYAVGGIPVRGAGAKTLAYVEPEAGKPRFCGVYHAWRGLGKGTDLKLSSLEEALAVGLLTDPELDRYSAAGHKIALTRLELVYLALPAFMRQSHLFPAFQIEGIVSEGKLGISFHFGRFHHAAPARAYAEAGLFGSYLSTNPDGITPTDARKAVG
jgi:hypothetical protein